MAAAGANYGRAFHSKDSATDALLSQRYSLSDQGSTVLTVAVMHYGTARFPQMCMNNMANLAPSCGSCNNAKKNILFATR